MKIARFVTAAIAIPLLAAAAAADPRVDYMMHCRGCHGPDGNGVTGGAPPFGGQVGKYLAVPGGREYLIRVPGISQSELDDAQVAELLNWLLREFDAPELASDFRPITAGEVTQLRRPPLTDPGTVRRALWKAIETGQP